MNFLIPQIQKALLEKESRKRTSHYPSDITACQRQLFYKWIGKTVSNPISANALLKMEFGNALHEKVSKLLQFKDLAPEVKTQKKFPNLTYPLSGSIDNIYLENSEYYMIEVKSSFGRGIQDMRKKGGIKPEYLAQVVCYFELAKDIPIRNCHLLVLARDSAVFDEFIIKLVQVGELEITPLVGTRWHEEYNFDKILNKLRELEISIARNSIPDREYTVAIKNGEIRKEFQKNKQKIASDWQCMYCQWLDECWGEEVEKYRSGDNAHEFETTSINVLV